MNRITSKNFIKLVYVCSPFSAPNEEGMRLNTLKAQWYCRQVVDAGYLPIASHLLFPQFMDEETEREKAMRLACILLGKCHEVWVIGETISPGMKAEIEYARKLGKVIRYLTEDLEEVK